MSKHTPGPWFAQESIRDGWYICARDVEHIVVDSHDVGGFYGVIIKDADARLIAAAPELLEALECYVEKVADLNRYGVIIETSLREKAEAAIAKAKGVLAEGDSEDS